MDLTVVSYNIRNGAGSGEKNPYDNWDQRQDNLVDYMNTMDADFICVQEAYSFQMKYLTDNLDVRSYDYIGIGRDDGAFAGEYAGVLFDNSKFDLISSIIIQFKFIFYN